MTAPIKIRVGKHMALYRYLSRRSCFFADTGNPPLKRGAGMGGPSKCNHFACLLIEINNKKCVKNVTKKPYYNRRPPPRTTFFPLLKEP